MTISILSLLQRIVCIAGFAALVTGCSGSSLSLTPATNMQRRPAVGKTTPQRAGFLNGEIFNAANVVIKPAVCRGSRDRATFSAKGSATGPYPGTFTATGSWELNYREYSGAAWSFHEGFAISSKSGLKKGNINGHGWDSKPWISCHHFGGPAGLRYYQVFANGKHSRSGLLSTNRIANNLREAFL